MPHVRLKKVAAWVRYGDLKARNVRGVVLESFGVGNMPDLPRLGWLPWLKKTVKQGIKVSFIACIPFVCMHFYKR